MCRKWQEGDLEKFLAIKNQNKPKPCACNKLKVKTGSIVALFRTQQHRQLIVFSFVILFDRLRERLAWSEIKLERNKPCWQTRQNLPLFIRFHFILIFSQRIFTQFYKLIKVNRKKINFQSFKDKLISFLIYTYFVCNTIVEYISFVFFFLPSPFLHLKSRLHLPTSFHLSLLQFITHFSHLWPGWHFDSFPTRFSRWLWNHCRLFLVCSLCVLSISETQLNPTGDWGFCSLHHLMLCEKTGISVCNSVYTPFRHSQADWRESTVASYCLSRHNSFSLSSVLAAIEW